MERIWGLSTEIGCYGVIVDAKSEDAERFYARFSFVSLTEAFPRRMFLPMSVIEQLVRLE
jgi:hypothetical protein